MLLVGAGWFRAKALAGWKDFNKIRDPAKPSLNAGPSALDTVIGGGIGCIGALVSMLLMIVFLLAAADFLLFRGVYSVAFLSRLLR
jgi:hypothetical protein